MEMQNKIEVELDSRTLKMEDIVENVIKQLTANGHTCRLQTMSSMPVFFIDGELYRARITSSVGAYFGIQKVVLIKEKT